MKKRPVVLCILDGFGINNIHEYNAIYNAKKPNLDRLMKECPFVLGQASGEFVGLPDGQMGNSEVGHLNIGSGRVVFQELSGITNAIKNGSFFENKVLNEVFDNCIKSGKNLHLAGLVSDGGVHSYNGHIYGLLEMAKRKNFNNVYVHCFLDGRDTPPTSGLSYVEELENKMKEIGVGKIASVSGRYYAMDRDNRWDRVELAYNNMTGKAVRCFESAVEGIKNSYDMGENDEFVQPFVVAKDLSEAVSVKDNDGFIFFNFRPDRARELTKVFCLDDFNGFEREKRINTEFVCFTDYDSTINNKKVVFVKEDINNTLGQVIAANGLKQIRIAETEKYAHVTFFFNGGVEAPNPMEDRILVDSPKDVATYDEKPEMSCKKVCEKVCEAINSDKYDVVITNFANPDMVGHTGNMEAATKAIEYVDECVGKIVDVVEKNNGVMFVCADHGNADQMVDYETGKPMTAHTTNPVPFILVNADKDIKLREGGSLCDIAPTLLELLGIPQPEEMTGKSLLIK